MLGDLGRRPACWPPRPARWTSSAPSSCATSSTARSWSSSSDGRRQPSSPFAARRARPCVFEYVYFARPDSVVERPLGLRGAQAHGRASWPRESAGGRRRGRAGARLRRAGGARAIARRAGIPFEIGIIRNHYVGPHLHRADARHPPFRRQAEAQPNRAMLEGKRVVLVDDSIVRGTTSRKIVKMVRDAGAKEVHMRIAIAADHAFLLLRHRHARARQAAGRQHDVEEMARLHRRRQPGLPLRRRALLGHGRADGRDPARAAVHRPLFHRRLSDPRSTDEAGTAANAACGGAGLALEAETPDHDRCPLTAPSRRADRPDHRRLARHWRRGRPSARRRRRPSRPRRPHRRRPRGVDDRSAPRAAAGDPDAPRPTDARRHRPAGALHAALRPAGHPGRQRRHARARWRRSAPFGPKSSSGDDGQRHGQLPADPLPRSAAAPVRRRARDLRHRSMEGESVPFWGLYGASKLALEAMVRRLLPPRSPGRAAGQPDLAGVVGTALRAKAFPGDRTSKTLTPARRWSPTPSSTSPNPPALRHGETVHSRLRTC